MSDAPSADETLMTVLVIRYSWFIAVSGNWESVNLPPVRMLRQFDLPSYSCTRAVRSCMRTAASVWPSLTVS